MKGQYIFNILWKKGKNPIVHLNSAKEIQIEKINFLSDKNNLIKT